MNFGKYEWMKIVPFILLLLFMGKALLNNNRCHFLYRFIEDRSLEGTVKRIFVDHDNHAEPAIELTNGEIHYYLESYLSSMYSSLSVGDSVFKAKEDSVVYVYKFVGGITEEKKYLIQCEQTD